VLYLHHARAIGGAENSVRLLLGHLDRHTIEPLLAAPPSGPFPDAVRGEGTPVVPLEFTRLRDVRGLLRSAGAIARLVRSRHIDMLHGNGVQTNLPGGIAGRLVGVPIVWHERTLRTTERVDIDRVLGGLATRIVCNSDAIRERFRGSRAWSRTVTVLNAVDVDEFHPGVSGATVRSELGIPAGVALVGLVARVTAGKGHEHFIDAALSLIRADARARFVVVGDAVSSEDTALLDGLRRRVNHAGADGRIVFTGFRRDVPRIMRALDVMVLASDAEPCGRVLFEAMASGTAVVATASGGTPEIVRDGEHGVLVTPRDGAALCEAVDRLVRDPALRERLGRHAADHARRHFGIAAHVRRMASVYDDALTAYGRARRR
jgi:glycosyltransferase involved in cell wall biosynthesis